MISDRKPAKLHQSRSSEVKSAWKKSGKRQPLKQFARSVAMATAGTEWFHNKRANRSNPPLGIGATRRKKGGQQKK